MGSAYGFYPALFSGCDDGFRGDGRAVVAEYYGEGEAGVFVVVGVWRVAGGGGFVRGVAEVWGGE